MTTRLIALGLVAVALAAPPAANAQTAPAPTQPPQTPTRRPDVIYVPTPEEVVEAMLQVAKVTKNDIVYDLGCGRRPHPGDGGQEVRRPRRRHRHRPAADQGSERERPRRTASATGCKIIHGDLFETDISEATVVTLYLLPSLNLKLIPKLMKELKPGTRIVSHAFDMGDWKPEQELDVNGRKVYFWTIPKR